MKCIECGHLNTQHGKQIPERPPSHCHICVCASNVNMDGTPSGKPCDCGGDDIQPAYFDEGCFAKDGDKFCGCISFLGVGV